MRSVWGGAGQPHLEFVACPHQHTDELQQMFGLWAQLRHHDALQVSGDAEGLTTVAIVLTPRENGQRQWDTTMVAVSGEVKLPTRNSDSYVIYGRAERRTDLLVAAAFLVVPSWRILALVDT